MSLEEDPSRQAECCPSTEEASTQPQLHYDQQRKASKKKKSRGNRKLQRFRAKLKRQGLNTETMATMIEECNNLPRHDQQQRDVLATDISMKDFVESDDQEGHETTQRKTTKRKRELRPAAVTTSLSQISIVQPSKKHQRSTTADNMTPPKDMNKSKLKDKPDYLQINDQTFKKMLSTSLEGAETIVQLLDTSEKLQYARHYAQLVNNLFYLRIKHDF